MTLAYNLPPIIALMLGLTAWFYFAWQHRRLARNSDLPAQTAKIDRSDYARFSSSRARVKASRSGARYPGRAQLRQRAGE